MKQNLTKLFLLVILTLQFSSCSTNSCTTTAAPVSPAKTTYMRSDLYAEFKAQIPDFPAKGSPAQAADEAELRKLQKSRTKADCKRAESEVEVTLQNLYGLPYGMLTPQQVTVLQPLFDEVRKEGGPYIGQTKQGYNRLRPYLYISDLKPCISTEPSLAYPSGHATLAALYGMVLADLFPQNKIALEKRAEQIGQDRLLGGVHHPTDVQSGKKLGLLIYAELKKSKAYNDDIEKYKKYLN